MGQQIFVKYFIHIDRIHFSVAKPQFRSSLIKLQLQTEKDKVNKYSSSLVLVPSA